MRDEVREVNKETCTAFRITDLGQGSDGGEFHIALLAEKRENFR